jgi:hypothetical protein
MGGISGLSEKLLDSQEGLFLGVSKLVKVKVK